ncbi:MAG: endonuclease/exonuclease/phosphatase family protein [Chromatiales bacterium]
MFRTYRLAIYLTFFCLSLLSACVSVPEQPQLIRIAGQVEQSPGCSSPVSTQAKVEAGFADGFSLVSWNIHKGSGTGWSRDLHHIMTDIDLLLLQEAYLDQDLQFLLGEWSPHWVMGPAFSIQGIPSGVLTAARIDSSAACANLVNEPVLGIPKAVLLNYYPISGQGRSMLVVNIHGINFTLGTKQLTRQLDFIAEAIANHPGPVIMGGDFNTWSQARMRQLRKMTASAGLKAVGFDQQQRSRHLGQVVDHIYYRGLKLVHSQVLAVYSSDHLPLRADFELE